VEAYCLTHKNSTASLLSVFAISIGMLIPRSATDGLSFVIFYLQQLLFYPSLAFVYTEIIWLICLEIFFCNFLPKVE